ncbi:phosphate ABC transporter permease subunit PstC [Isosphaeraceae bacterium EP7]
MRPDSLATQQKISDARSNWSGPSRWLRAQEAGVGVFLRFCAIVTIMTTIGIVAVLASETIQFFRVSGIGPIAFLFGTELSPDAEPPKFGILPLVWGTFVVAVGSSVIALPIGLLSALYLSEYAPRKLRTLLKPSLELLAGVPTIVYGSLALILVTPMLRAVLQPLGLKVETFNVLSACVVVGVMIIPMVSSLSEDVLTAVPRGLREAGYALGATKYEVSTRIVLPAALSGVVASFILAISRAIGETMAVVLAAGSRPQLTFNLLTSMETMTAYIVSVLSGEASAGSAEYLSLFAVGSALFAITLALNVLSSAVLRRYREPYQ